MAPLPLGVDVVKVARDVVVVVDVDFEWVALHFLLVVPSFYRVSFFFYVCADWAFLFYLPPKKKGQGLFFFRFDLMAIWFGLGNGWKGKPLFFFTFRTSKVIAETFTSSSESTMKKKRGGFAFLFFSLIIERWFSFLMDLVIFFLLMINRVSSVGRRLWAYRVFLPSFFFSLPAKPAWWKGKKNSVGKKNNRKEMRKKQKMDDRRRRRPCYRRPMGRGPRHPSAAVDPIGETQYHLPIENSVHPIKKRPRYISFPKISKKKSY